MPLGWAAVPFMPRGQGATYALANTDIVFCQVIVGGCCSRSVDARRFGDSEQEKFQQMSENDDPAKPGAPNLIF
ncbi:MAG: hypothetical protein GDA36_02650 [Rhodobacteraceae bacterium]|nr:hypothetical protein [Paracoccaceae bacterium]